MTTTSIPIWQQAFTVKGRHCRWTDMPGADTENKKLNFALWRRGLIEVEALAEDAKDLSTDAPTKLVNKAQRCRKPPVNKSAWKGGDKLFTLEQRYPNGLPAHMKRQCQPGELEALCGRLMELAKERGIRQHELVARFGINRNKINPSGLKASGDKLKQKLEYAISKLSSPESEKIA